MLTYMRVKNFKNLTDLFFDLRDSHGNPKHTAIVYGENGSGKTNLVSSMLFLIKSSQTLSNQFIVKDELLDKVEEIRSKVNDPDISKSIIDDIVKRRYFSLADLVSEYQSLASEEGISIEIGFELNGSRGSYRIVCNNLEVIEEELRFLISKRTGVYFSIDQEKVYISNSIFTSREYLLNLHSLVEQYWGKHSFLSILNFEIQQKNKKFIHDNISDNFRVFNRWIDRMSILCHSGHGDSGRLAVPREFLTKLKKGRLVSDVDILEKDSIEKAINLFFSNLYSDIKRVYYKNEETSKGTNYKLFLRKEIGGDIVEIPFNHESAGTQKLLELFPFIYSLYLGNTVIIDELDNGIHDLLISSIINEITELNKGQLIATTHATTIMNSVKPDNLFIIASNPFGNSEIQCLSDYSFRTQNNNNVRNKYLKGDYQGIPIIGSFNLEDIFSSIDEIDSNKLTEE